MHTVSKAPGRVAVVTLVVTTLCLLLTDSSRTSAAGRHLRRGRLRLRHTARHHHGQPRYRSTSSSIGTVLEGRATWYGPGFYGRRTASGEPFNRYDFTLASRGLPMQTMVRITNLKNGRSAVGRVNDRGPYAHGAIVDLSEALARRVGMGGTSRVRIQVLGRGG